MNKKGFTLIELLAVIVILAVIALIVTPVVTSIISSSKSSADMRSAEGYVKAADDYFAGSQINEEKKNNLGTNIIDKIEVQNGQASGSIIVDETGKVEMAIVINNKCYKKAKDANEITVDDKDNCNIVTAVVPPDRCFEYETINSNTAVMIDKYKCGNSFKKMNGTTPEYNTDGEFVNIELPSTIGGKPVTRIFQDAFSPYNEGDDNDVVGSKVGITSLIIPSGMTTIDGNSFGKNQLVSVSLPNTISFIAPSFNDNPTLTTIKIDKASGSIAGSPWGAPTTATITYLR